MQTRIFNSKALSLPCIFILVGLTSCSQTPSIANLKSCEELNSDGACQDGLSAFQDKKQKLFVSGSLINASQDTSVQVELSVSKNGLQVPITTTTVNPTNSDDFVTASFSSPTNGWPEGTYLVVFTLPEGNRSFPFFQGSSSPRKFTKEFTVKP
jgi:hypothetical protein